MSAADQLTNFGAVMHHTPALLSAKSSPPGRADRLEVSTPVCTACPLLTLSFMITGASDLPGVSAGKL
jgi:hypothetical protein